MCLYGKKNLPVNEPISIVNLRCVTVTEAAGFLDNLDILESTVCRTYSRNTEILENEID